MDPRLSLIAQSFDLKKLDRLCNEKDCKKPPSKKTLISETDKLTMKKRDLVILNLCTKHLEHIKKFLREMDELTARDKVIGVEVLETGYVTH